ncbi:MAG: secondary thiamine-phosphate synthase enzyme YjbQ [Boseongicola sp.]
MTETIEIQTDGPGLYEFTKQVQALAVENGVMTIFVQHTSCSLLIQENADPGVQADLLEYFQRLVPPADDPSMDYLIHRSEGPDDMPAHIKASMLPVCLHIPVITGRLALGTWQGIYLFEHRVRPHRRKVVCSLR